MHYIASKDSRTNYRFQEDIETAWDKNAAVIFSLIPNASEITFHLEDEYMKKLRYLAIYQINPTDFAKITVNLISVNPASDWL